MTRPTRDEMFMQVAHVVKQRSTCLRAQVGAIITNADGTSIRSMGYNGNARGLPDTCDGTVPGQCGCLHAEENALLKAPYGEDLVMYTTTTPCVACAKRILNSTVRTVVFGEPYRDLAGLELITEQGVATRRCEGLTWWQGQIHDAKKENGQLKNLGRLKDAAIACLMKAMNPSWKPGRALEHDFTEVWLQAVQETRVEVGFDVSSQHKTLNIRVR